MDILTKLINEGFNTKEPKKKEEKHKPVVQKKRQGAYCAENYVQNMICVEKKNIIASSNLTERIRSEIGEGYKGGIIVFSTEVNANEASTNKVLNFIKKKLSTIKNTMTYKSKVSNVLKNYDAVNPEVKIIGWTLGTFVHGMYTADDGSVFDEKSLSLELVGIPQKDLFKVAELICREFNQQSVLVKSYDTGRIVFINAEPMDYRDYETAISDDELEKQAKEKTESKRGAKNNMDKKSIMKEKKTMKERKTIKEAREIDSVATWADLKNDTVLRFVATMTETPSRVKEEVKVFNIDGGFNLLAGAKDYWVNRPWYKFRYANALKQVIVALGETKDFAEECIEKANDFNEAVKYFAEHTKIGNKEEVKENHELVKTPKGVWLKRKGRKVESVKTSKKNSVFNEKLTTKNKAKKPAMKKSVFNESIMGNRKTNKKGLKEELKLYVDISEYSPWSGAIDTWQLIADNDKIDELESYLEDSYPDGLSLTELNDILWFEPEDVLEALGISENDEDDEDDVDECFGKSKALKEADEKEKKLYKIVEWVGRVDLDYWKKHQNDDYFNDSVGNFEVVFESSDLKEIRREFNKIEKAYDNMMLRGDLSDFYDVYDGELISYDVEVETYIWDENSEEYEITDVDDVYFDFGCSITFGESYEKYLSFMEDEDQIEKAFEKIDIEAEFDERLNKWILSGNTALTDSTIEIQLYDFEREKLNPMILKDVAKALVDYCDKVDIEKEIKDAVYMNNKYDVVKYTEEEIGKEIREFYKSLKDKATEMAKND